MIFFSKKLFLADYLNGYVDIHNHIIPGLDDGAKTIEDSLGLIQGFQEFGVNRFVCTPHIMHNYYDNTPSQIKKSFDRLNNTISKIEKFKEVNLNYAAEHLIDDNFENILQKDKVLPLNEQHLLIEMSYLQPSINFTEAIEKIKKKGYFPVFAHPERYQYLAMEYGKYTSYKENGIKFQLNMLSLSDYYGPSIRKNAMKLLSDGMYDFIASDVHNLKHLLYLKNNVTITKKVLNKLQPIINSTIRNFY